jgi:primosomal protein N' (replication factor Y)
LNQRQAAGFPPFAHLALMRAEAQQVEHANAFLLAARHCWANRTWSRPTGRCRRRCRGAPATSARSCCLPLQRPPLHGVLAAGAAAVRAPEARKVRWSLDVDPTDLY